MVNQLQPAARLCHKVADEPVKSKELRVLRARVRSSGVFAALDPYKPKQGGEPQASTTALKSNNRNRNDSLERELHLVV